MSMLDIATLFGLMALLAAVPSTSVALVVVRSATAGIGNGMAVAAGIVLGDLVFVMLALLGLSVAAELMGGFFLALKYLGAAYLVWLGVVLLRSGRPVAPRCRGDAARGGRLAGFVAGFALTLGDVKAILFYASLFPLFVDLPSLRPVDAVAIVIATIAGVGGVKLVYALLAARIASRINDSGFAVRARRLAGGLMVAAGAYLVARP
jgi:threonine/homoserine/homoserine lactone efflux protein